MYIHFDTCQIYIYNIYVYVYVYSACGLSGRSWPCAGLRRVRWNAPMALDCAECAGMRRLRWNALESTDCAFAPNCAVCAELRRLRCLRRIALEFCLQPGTQPILPCGCRSLVATSVLQSCQVFVAHSRSPATSLQLSVREINNSGQKLNVLLF